MMGVHLESKLLLPDRVPTFSSLSYMKVATYQKEEKGALIRNNKFIILVKIDMGPTLVNGK